MSSCTPDTLSAVFVESMSSCTPGTISALEEEKSTTS